MSNGPYRAVNGLHDLSYYRGRLYLYYGVTPALVQQGLILALLLGFIGGVFPAVRAARLPVVEALRAA